MVGSGGALVATLVIFGLVQRLAATTYPVEQPGSNGVGGWTYLYSTQGSYDDNFRNTTLYVGDILTFTFGTNVHNVVTVPPGDIPTCDSSHAIQTYAESVALTLETAGKHGFLCSLESHCTSYGMHLVVTVLDAPAKPPANSTGGGPETFLRSGSALMVGALIAASAALAL